MSTCRIPGTSWNLQGQPKPDKGDHGSLHAGDLNGVRRWEGVCAIRDTLDRLARASLQ